MELNANQSWTSRSKSINDMPRCDTIQCSRCVSNALDQVVTFSTDLAEAGGTCWGRITAWTATQRQGYGVVAHRLQYYSQSGFRRWDRQMGLLVDLRGVIQTLTQNDHLTFQPTYLNISTLHIFMVVCNLRCVYDKHISVHESGWVNKLLNHRLRWAKTPYPTFSFLVITF